MPSMLYVDLSLLPVGIHGKLGNMYTPRHCKGELVGCIEKSVALFRATDFE